MHNNNHIVCSVAQFVFVTMLILYNRFLEDKTLGDKVSTSVVYIVVCRGRSWKETLKSRGILWTRLQPSSRKDGVNKSESYRLANGRAKWLMFHNWNTNR